MAMTLHTGKSSSHQRLPGRVHTVKHSRSSEFFIFRSAFIIGHGIPVKGSCNILRIRGIRHEVAGNLIPDELVVGFISIKCMNQPIAITPDAPAVVSFISLGICITGEVHPHGGPAFAILW